MDWDIEETNQEDVCVIEETNQEDVCVIFISNNVMITLYWILFK